MFARCLYVTKMFSLYMSLDSGCDKCTQAHSITLRHTLTYIMQFYTHTHADNDTK